MRKQESPDFNRGESQCLRDARELGPEDMIALGLSNLAADAFRFVFSRDATVESTL